MDIHTALYLVTEAAEAADGPKLDAAIIAAGVAGAAAGRIDNAKRKGEYYAVSRKMERYAAWRERNGVTGFGVG